MIEFAAPLVEPNLAGKVALVSGAASGIGRATACAFAQQGARLALIDRDIAGARAVADELTACETECIVIETDVRDGAALAKAVEAVMAQFGRLDVAHNNAGILGEQRNVVECSEAQWLETLSINLTGVFLAMKYQIPAMIASGGGAIVNTSSIGGIRGAAASAGYIAAKHGVIGLTRSAAVDFGPAGVRVNAVVPGAVDTAMLAPALSGTGIDRSAMTARTPLRRIARPDELAATVTWLCSDAASFVTGAAIVVDGGQTIMI